MAAAQQPVFSWSNGLQDVLRSRCQRQWCHSLPPLPKWWCYKMTVIRCMELSLTVVLSPIWQLLIPVPYDGFLHSWRLMGHVIYPQDTCFFTHPSPKAPPPPPCKPPSPSASVFLSPMALIYTAAGFVLRCVWNTT